MTNCGETGGEVDSHTRYGFSPKDPTTAVCTGQTTNYDEPTGLTANCNDGPTMLTATVCAGQTTNFNDEIRGRTDRQAMIQCEWGSGGPTISHGEGNP